MIDLAAFKSAISIGLLILQIGLFVATVAILPLRVKLSRSGAFTFLLWSVVGWVLYTVLAMLGDGYLGNDVPGFGYLVIGIIAGTIGIIVYLIRWSRAETQ